MPFTANTMRTPSSSCVLIMQGFISPPQVKERFQSARLEQHFCAPNCSVVRVQTKLFFYLCIIASKAFVILRRDDIIALLEHSTNRYLAVHTIVCVQVSAARQGKASSADAKPRFGGFRGAAAGPTAGASFRPHFERWDKSWHDGRTEPLDFLSGLRLR